MDTQILVAIKTGVVSGIITALFIWGIRKFWVYILSPKLEQYFYNGVLLDGTWTAVVTGKMIDIDNILQAQQRHLTINLKQKGSKVTGTFYARSETKIVNDTTGNNKNEYSNQYKLNGKVVDNYLVLNYNALSRNRTGLGSIVLRVTQGGTKLDGGISYVGEGSEYIYTLEKVEFIRSI